MMARSVSSANPINRRQTPAALPLVLLFPAEFQRFALASAADWADSTRPLPIFSRFADFASWDCAGADGNCALQQEAISTLGRFAKRILDFLLASIAILLLCPLMPAIAVAVRLESQGPAIYPSLRVGKRGMLFVCHKFRTMNPGANRLRNNLLHLNQRRGPFFKMADDPRVTQLGRFLRKYSLDDLPQLWNVLKGDMSLVGPCPDPLEDVAQYGPGREEHLARQNLSLEICMPLDDGYIRDWSMWLDCKILLRTISAVLAGEGQ